MIRRTRAPQDARFPLGTDASAGTKPPVLDHRNVPPMKAKGPHRQRVEALLLLIIYSAHPLFKG